MDERTNQAGNDRASRPVKKFLRHLLAATCLTAVGAVAANADTFTESTDFGDTFASASLLPAGTDTVIGQVFSPQTPSDLYDYFKFIGLTPSLGFDLNFASTLSNVVGGAAFDSSGNQIGSGVGFGLGYPQDITGIIPSDGALVVEIIAEEGGPYTVKLTSEVPEPTALPIAAAGLLAVAGAQWRRRKKI